MVQMPIAISKVISWRNQLCNRDRFNSSGSIFVMYVNVLYTFQKQSCCVYKHLQKHFFFENMPHKTRQQQTLWAEPCYLVTSHEAQVAEGLAALSDLSGSLVCDVLTPAGIHSLYGTAVLAYGYQGYGHMRKTERG